MDKLSETVLSKMRIQDPGTKTLQPGNPTLRIPASGIPGSGTLGSRTPGPNSWDIGPIT